MDDIEIAALPGDPESHVIIGFSVFRDRALCSCGAVSVADHAQRAWVGPGHSLPFERSPSAGICARCGYPAEHPYHAIGGHVPDVPRRVNAERPTDAPGARIDPRMAPASGRPPVELLRPPLGDRPRETVPEPEDADLSANGARRTFLQGLESRGLKADVPRRTARTPSRTAEGRHQEYLRRKARKLGLEVPPTDREKSLWSRLERALAQATREKGNDA